MYQKIQHFKRKGFTKADIVRETGLNKRTVCKYYSMSEKEYSRYIEKVRYRTKISEPYQSHILEVYKVNDFQKLEKNVEVVGVETDKQMAKVAKEKINKVIVGNIERINLTDCFTPNYFDCIIFADVLEHLKDPWTVLKGTTNFLLIADL